MNSQFLILIIFFSLQILHGQEIIEIWPDQVPGETEANDLSYSKKDGGVTRLFNVNKPIMRVYKPMKENDNGHSMIICPGGGYHILAIDLEGSEIAYWLSDLGYTAYVLEYRVPEKPEFALMDVQRAVKIVRSRTADSKKTGILGFSAGGHLSAAVSTLLDVKRYKSQDELSEYSSRPDFAALIYPAYLDRGVFKNLSPEIHMDKSTPPMFIFMTADDPYVNGTFMLSQALMKNKTLLEYHIYPEGGHGYGLRKNNPAGIKWTELCEKWLNSQIKE